MDEQYYTFIFFEGEMKDLLAKIELLNDGRKLLFIESNVTFHSLGGISFEPPLTCMGQIHLTQTHTKKAKNPLAFFVQSLFCSDHISGCFTHLRTVH
jgi:hypothetical protein